MWQNTTDKSRFLPLAACFPKAANLQLIQSAAYQVICMIKIAFVEVWLLYQANVDAVCEHMVFSSSIFCVTSYRVK